MVTGYFKKMVPTWAVLFATIPDTNVRNLQAHVSCLLSYLSEHVLVQFGLVGAIAHDTWNSLWPLFIRPSMTLILRIRAGWNRDPLYNYPPGLGQFQLSHESLIMLLYHVPYQLSHGTSQPSHVSCYCQMFYPCCDIDKASCLMYHASIIISWQLFHSCSIL